MEALALAGAFVGTSVWMMRYSMQQQRQMAERFIQHLQQMLAEQRQESKQARAAIRQLTGAVRRNSALIVNTLQHAGPNGGNMDVQTNQGLQGKVNSKDGIERNKGNNKKKVSDKRVGF